MWKLTYIHFLKFPRRNLNVFVWVNLGLSILLFVFLFFPIGIVVSIFDTIKISKFIYTYWYMFYFTDLTLKILFLRISVDQLRYYSSLLVKKHTLGNYYIFWNSMAPDNFILLFLLLPLVFGMISNLGALNAVTYLLVAFFLTIVNRFLLLIITLMFGIRFLALLLLPLLYYVIKGLTALSIFTDPFNNVIYSALVLIISWKCCHFLILKKTNL